MKTSLPKWPPRGSANRITVERLDGTSVTILYLRSLWNKRISRDLRVQLIHLQDESIDYYMVVSRMTGLRFLLPRKHFSRTRKSMYDPTPRRSATIGIVDMRDGHYALERQWTDMLYGEPGNYETLVRDWARYTRVQTKRGESA